MTATWRKGKGSPTDSGRYFSTDILEMWCAKVLRNSESEKIQSVEEGYPLIPQSWQSLPSQAHSNSFYQKAEENWNIWARSLSFWVWNQISCWVCWGGRGEERGVCRPSDSNVSVCFLSTQCEHTQEMRQSGREVSVLCVGCCLDFQFNWCSAWSEQEQHQKFVILILCKCMAVFFVLFSY